MHTNSIAAHHAEKENLSKRSTSIAAVFADMDEPLTDREVAALLNFGDMNSVRPRITELCKAGVIYEYDSVVCTVTGKTVRRCRITPKQLTN